MAAQLPHIITFPSITPFVGKTIVINEKETLLLFPIKRLYWISYQSQETTYGEHAHQTVQQIVVSLSGKVTIRLENTAGITFQFCLQHAHEGLYIPPMYWKKIEYSEPCTLLCLASEEYNEVDYIRDYQAFKQTITA